MMQISILGCGWLGIPLASRLIQLGFKVKGSTTTFNKLPALLALGIEPYLLKIGSRPEENIKGFLENSEILIINVPPKQKDSNLNFLFGLPSFIKALEKSKIKKVLLVSSISVYGSDNRNITEESSIDPQTETSKQLVDTEALIQKNKNYKSTIVRFGGLIGPDRHPVKYLAGKSNIENPKARINLIHIEDCLCIITKIITDNIWDQVINAVSPYHPTRIDFYTQAALDLGLSPPKFCDGNDEGKTVSSNKLEQVLGYEFQNAFLK